jgi:predicted RNA-binding protein
VRSAAGAGEAIAAEHHLSSQRRKKDIMADPEALAELDQRIAIVRDNLRELVEQAAAYSGAADEARNADRIADQEAKLAALRKEREALAG